MATVVAKRPVAKPTTSTKPPQKQSTAVAKPAPAEMAVDTDYDNQEETGFENQTNEDILVPFWDILQPNSPELETIDGAKAGMIINRSTKEVLNGDEGLVFVPATTQHVYVEWIPKDKGGGLVEVHPLNSQMVTEARNSKRFGKIELDNGNELMETFYAYGLRIGEEETMAPCVIAFGSTKITPYKGWMFQARALTVMTSSGKVPAPLWSHQYRLRTTKQKNAKGTFYNWVIGLDGGSAATARLAGADPRVQAAKDVSRSVNSGITKADVAHTAQEETEDVHGLGPAPAAKGGKAPF